MLSDWLETQKKPTRTNQIRAVLITKIRENGHGFQQTTTGFNFVSKTTIEKLKNIYSKNPNTVKSTSFWLNVLKMRYEEKNTVNKMKENEPEKLKNKLLITDCDKVKK